MLEEERFDLFFGAPGTQPYRLAINLSGTTLNDARLQDFVPDEIIDRFCIIGPVPEQVRRLEELKSLGVTQFAVYLQHDDKDHTLAQYGEKVIPAIQDTVLAKS